MTEEMNLDCPVCKTTIKDPVIGCKTEHVFCRRCITKIDVNGEQCPICFDPVIEQLVPCTKTRELLAHIDAKCDCGWKGNLNNIAQHYEICKYHKLVKCVFPKCNVFVNEIDLHKHVKQCVHRCSVLSYSIFDNCNEIPEYMLLHANQSVVEEKTLEIQGICYEHGFGVARDERKAFNCYCRSFEKEGNINALCKMAICYVNGIGVENNFAKAQELFIQCAEQGNLFAQTTIGIMYFSLKEKDLGIKWLKQATKNDYPPAQTKLGLIYVWCFEEKKDIGKSLLIKAVKKGYVSAMAALGSLYIRGDFIEKDLQKGFDLLQQAADQGSVRAQLSLAHYFYDLRDYHSALKWYTNAADCGNDNAQLLVGYFYKIGLCISKNMKMAFGWFQKAQLQGNIAGSYELAECYRYGYGTSINYNLAIEYYKPASEKDYKDSQYKLGVLYLFHGYAKLGIELIEKAVKKGDKNAMFMLGFAISMEITPECDWKRATQLIDNSIHDIHNEKLVVFANAIRQAIPQNEKRQQLARKILCYAAEKGNQKAHDLLLLMFVCFVLFVCFSSNLLPSNFFYQLSGTFI